CNDEVGSILNDGTQPGSLLLQPLPLRHVPEDEDGPGLAVSQLPGSAVQFHGEAAAVGVHKDTLPVPAGLPAAQDDTDRTAVQRRRCPAAGSGPKKDVVRPAQQLAAAAAQHPLCGPVHVVDAPLPVQAAYARQGRIQDGFIATSRLAGRSEGIVRAGMNRAKGAPIRITVMGRGHLLCHRPRLPSLLRFGAVDSPASISLLTMW